MKGDMKHLLQHILVADREKRYSLEEIKKHPYFKDISFLKVYKKEYGPIITKRDESKDEVLTEGGKNKEVKGIEDEKEKEKNKK